MILPGINTITGLTLQNGSQTRIKASVMGSEPTVAAEPSKVTALTQGCDLTKSARIRDVCHQSEEVFQGLESSKRIRDVMYVCWRFDFWNIKDKTEPLPSYFPSHPQKTIRNKKRQQRELKLNGDLLMHHNLNSVNDALNTKPSWRRC